MVVSQKNEHYWRVLIFPKAQAAANKNAHYFQKHFRAQFFILVLSNLFGVFTLKTLKWKFLIAS